MQVGRRQLSAVRGVGPVLLAWTLVGALVRLWQLRHGYAHGVVGYDDGVYLGTSLALVDGHVPYRDFVLVQPPVVPLLMAPLAVLAKSVGTAQAMGLARIATAIVGATNIALTGWLVRDRGRVVVAVACGILALYGDAVTSSTQLLLEPWATLFCLLGAIAVYPRGEVAHGRRLVWGGVLFGIGCASKIWAFALVLAVLLLLTADRRRLARFGGGVVAGFAVPCLPFLMLAPGSFVHQVFVVQLARGAALRTPIPFRLQALAGHGAVDGTRFALTSVPVLLAFAAGALLVGMHWVTRRGSAPLDLFVRLGLVLVIELLLAPMQFYGHYAAFAAPWVALAVAVPLGRLPARVPAGRAILVVAMAWVLLLAGYLVVHRPAPRHDYARELDAVIPRGACVLSTSVSDTIADDRFSSDDRCPLILDPYGTVLSYTGHTAGGTVPKNAAWQALWMRLLSHADFLLISRAGAIPWDVPLVGYLEQHFHRVPVPGANVLLLARDGPRRPWHWAYSGRS